MKKEGGFWENKTGKKQGMTGPEEGERFQARWTENGRLCLDSYFCDAFGQPIGRGWHYFRTRRGTKITTQFMNLAYTKLLKIRGRLHEFNFRKKSRRNPTCYVDCTDDRGSRFFITMVRGEEGSWQLSTPDLPPWIVEAENLIAAAIAEEEARR